jgi:hypothetical protein
VKNLVVHNDICTLDPLHVDPNLPSIPNQFWQNLFRHNRQNVCSWQQFFQPVVHQTPNPACVLARCVAKWPSIVKIRLEAACKKKIKDHVQTELQNSY